MPAIDYLTCDVFTDRPFGGNPLAVVFPERELASDLMQSIAAEFGYSETSFVNPPVDSAHTARVRIFTPTQELPFAGHPTIGTALALFWQDHKTLRSGSIKGAGASENHPNDERLLILEEGAGPVPVKVRFRSGAPVFAELQSPTLPLETKGASAAGSDASLRLSSEKLAPALGLALEALNDPACMDCGPRFWIAELPDSATVARARLDPGLWSALPSDALPDAVLIFARNGADDLHMRVFAPALGIPEDPATGSAAVALAAYLARRSSAPVSSELRWRIRQGAEIGRPSQLFARAMFQNETLHAVFVGGEARLMMRGKFILSDSEG